MHEKSFCNFSILVSTILFSSFLRLPRIFAFFELKALLKDISERERARMGRSSSLFSIYSYSARLADLTLNSYAMLEFIFAFLEKGSY